MSIVSNCNIPNFGQELAYFYPLKTRNSLMGTLSDSADLDEMRHHDAFYQDLHCLLRQNRSSEKDLQYFYLKL